MSKQFIERGWESYRRMVVPADAGAVQLQETKQAFFAGAAILWQAIKLSLDPGGETTDADIQRMQAVQDELDGFGQQLDARYLKTAEH